MSIDLISEVTGGTDYKEFAGRVVSMKRVESNMRIKDSPILGLPAYLRTFICENKHKGFILGTKVRYFGGELKDYQNCGIYHVLSDGITKFVVEEDITLTEDANVLKFDYIDFLKAELAERYVSDLAEAIVEALFMGNDEYEKE